MCAIAGLWVKSSVPACELRAWAAGMAASMAHRGPDGQGVWTDPSRGLALAHSRLAIRDPSSAALQPMLTPQGRQALVFNGEIDNHAEWRRELQRSGAALGHRSPDAPPIEFSSGDSETLLHALTHWGAGEVCRRSQGMWAWGFFDGEAERLTLSRDRMGKKPLYWIEADWGMAFASQLQAFRAIPLFSPRIHPAALSQYLRWGFVEGPESLLEGVRRVEPGQTLIFEHARCVSQRLHWCVDEAIAEGVAHRIADPRQATQQLESTLRQAVAQRMDTDVSVGAFLSGGIDSSLVVALMQELGAHAQTWCVGFDDQDHDESAAAQAIARHLGTRHETVQVDGRCAASLLPELARVMDEPLADASLIPTTALALHAAGSVKVVLTGDGGDEAFGGYPRYRMQGPLMQSLSRWPPALKRAIAIALQRVEPDGWRRLARLVPEAWRPTLPAAKMDKLVRWLLIEDPAARAQLGLMRWEPRMLWPDAPADSPLAQSIASPFSGLMETVGHRDSCKRALHVKRSRYLKGIPADPLSSSEQLQRWEMVHYLTGDLLAKMDRATMWASLEARSPLLDHRVVALAWRLPTSLKAEGPRLKEVLRRCLDNRLPRALVDRPKRGFTPPLDHWLRRDLRAPAHDLFEGLVQHTQGRWNTDLMRDAWAAQQAGTRHEVDRIWSLITLELWRREWKLDLP